MKRFTSPGGVNALEEPIEGAREASKPKHPVNPDAGPKLSGSIAQATRVLQEKVDFKKTDKKINVTAIPQYLEVTAALE